MPNGKTECWYILDAEPGATLGFGLREAVAAGALRAAALDGSIVDLLDWQTVRAGNSFYVPAGSVHAIGAGITLVEVLQNADLTYRLFDYGRPRELHLDVGSAFARREPDPGALHRHVEPRGTVTLVAAEAFTVHRFGGYGRYPRRARWLGHPLGRGRALVLAVPMAAAALVAGSGRETWGRRLRDLEIRAAD